MKSQIDAVKKEYDALKSELEKPGVVSDGKKMKEIGKRMSELEEIKAKIDELAVLRGNMAKQPNMIFYGYRGMTVAAMTMVSPSLTRTEPPACLAIRPVSKESFLPPPRSISTEFIISVPNWSGGSGI